MLSTQSFLSNAGIQDRAIHFRWDEWNTEMSDEPVDEELANRFKNLSYRANVVFTIVSADWILTRFTPLVDDTTPRQCLEAAWAQQIDFRYSWDWELDEEWTGPIKGPIRLAFDKVTWAVQEVRDYRDPSWAAASIAKLAEYVLRDPTPYVRWRAQIVSRLEGMYQLDADDPLGDVVPPQALDPDFSYDPGEAEKLMNNLLSALDYRTNSLLNSPETMLELDFEGTPYVFSLAEDRKHRIEW